MKKILGLFLSLFALITLVSCGGKTLATPTNVTLSGDVLSWDAVENASKYRLNCVNEEQREAKRLVDTNSVDLTTFNLAEGEYKIYVQSVAEKDSNYQDSSYTTEAVVYKAEEKLVYDELKSLTGKEVLSDSYVKWLGRTLYDEELQVNMIYHSGSGYEVKAVGSSITSVIYATNHNNSSSRPYLVYMVDDDYENRVRVKIEKKETTLIVEIPNDGEIHTLSVYKSTESTDSHLGLKSLETDGSFVPKIDYKERHIEFIAASSSTGYGNLGNKDTSKSSANSDCMQAFSYLTARALNADFNIQSASGWGVKFSNWTDPKSASLYEAYKYMDFSFYLKDKNSNFELYKDKPEVLWDTTKYTPNVIVINLGTNDWSYVNLAQNNAEREERLQQFKNQYVDFLSYLHNIYPECKIIMFYGLMLETNVYEATEQIYETAKLTNPDLAIIKVQGDAAGSAGHPSVASHKQVAEQLIAKIKSEMGW